MLYIDALQNEVAYVLKLRLLQYVPAKISSAEKSINIKPCWMYEWFDCHLPGFDGFTEYFLAAGLRNTCTLAFLHLKTCKTVDQNASLETELLDLKSIP